MKLYDFQKRGLEATSDKNKVAYYWEMGTGKTFVGSEKAVSFGKQILVVCQKSKIADWIEHFTKYYYRLVVRNITNDKCRENFIKGDVDVGVINYDSVWRKTDIAKLRNFTLLLDESSLIQNEKAKRSKFILYKLFPKNIVLLSGTPCNGKYENLWSQLHLLGWSISRQLYWDTYINYRVDTRQGFPLILVTGYKNIERLKSKLREYGANFLKSDEVIDLPEQVFNTVSVKSSTAYRRFRNDRIVTVEDKELVGNTTLTKLLYERMLCGAYSNEKVQAFTDLMESTSDRLIVFYNFNEELKKLKSVCDRPISIVNGSLKDLRAYENYEDSVTFIQYQSGAMGLNLQKANKIIYYTPPLSSELFEQSKKRTNRIGQTRTCFYYQLICKGSIEEKIYETLDKRKDFTNALFIETCNR